MAQIRELQNKVNSLSDAKEFYDPETASTSGATYVLDQTSTILSSRTLPRNTQNCTVIMGDVFEWPLAQEGLSSTMLHNSTNLAKNPASLRVWYLMQWEHGCEGGGANDPVHTGIKERESR